MAKSATKAQWRAVMIAEPKYLTEYRERLAKMTNFEVFDAYEEDAGGDMWGGGFSPQGWVKYCASRAELVSRLRKAGFFNEQLD